MPFRQVKGINTMSSSASSSNSSTNSNAQSDSGSEEDKEYAAKKTTAKKMAQPKKNIESKISLKLKKHEEKCRKIAAKAAKNRKHEETLPTRTSERTSKKVVYTPSASESEPEQSDDGKKLSTRSFYSRKSTNEEASSLGRTRSLRNTNNSASAALNVKSEVVSSRSSQRGRSSTVVKSIYCEESTSDEE